MIERRIWRQFDWLLFATVIALIVMGVVMIYSAAVGDPPISRLYLAQAGTGLVAVFILLLTASIDYQLFKNFAFLSYAVAIVSLVLVLLIGEVRFNARRWFDLGGFELQPGEVAKILLTVTLSKFIADRQGRHSYLSTIALSGLLIAPCVVLIMLQPNLSTALTILFLWIVMVMVGGLEREHLAIIAAGLAALLVVGLFVLISRIPADAVESNEQASIVAQGTPQVLVEPGRQEPAGTPVPTPAPLPGLIQEYQIRRIQRLFEPGDAGENYQSIQARIALGSGGIWGKGLLQGTQTQGRYFPVRHTDFIFSVIGEELGFVGSALCLTLLFTVILRTLWAALSAADTFGRLLCVGVAATLFLQTYINVGMQVGWAPVTGVVLPFISYGRTNLITVMLAIGIVQSVAMRHKRNAFASS